MGSSEEQLDELFEELEADKKNLVKTFRASDIRIGAHVPYGVLTRIPELDLSLGRPGYPVGKVIELYGLPRCGKTTAALMALAQVQKMGGSGLWIDTEYAFDPDRAEELGVNVDRMRVAEADTIEGVFRIINRVLKKMTDYSKPFVIVVDSATAVPTEWEKGKNEDMDSDRPGDQAKAIRKGMRLITPMIAKKKVLLLMINHAHETMAAWGKSTRASGGHGIKFHSSGRVLFKHMGDIQEEVNGVKHRLGQKIKIETEKVKGAHLRFPFCEVQLLNEGGFCTRQSLFGALKAIGVIQQASPHSKCQMGDQEFQKRNWDEVVEKNGGDDALYKLFIKEACDRGFLKAYNNQDVLQTSK